MLMLYFNVLRYFLNQRRHLPSAPLRLIPLRFLSRPRAIEDRF